MSSIWLPGRVYRSLPGLYAIAGLALMMLFRGNAIALLSSLLLISAGLLVTLWRFRGRTTVSTSASARNAFYQRKRRAAEANTLRF